MIDKLMKRYGYNLIKENEYGVSYEKQEPQNFTHVVHIGYKVSGKHIMQSYDKKVINGKNEVCGVEIPVLLLMWLKFIKMKFKYYW